MSWILLLIAGCFETGFAFCMVKARGAEGMTRNLWWAGFAACLALSMYLLYRATQTIPVGTAYAVWTGIGAVGTVIVGMLFLGEPVQFWRMFFLVTLIASVVGLKVVS